MQFIVQRQLKRRWINLSMVVAIALTVVNVFVLMRSYHGACSDTNHHSEKLKRKSEPVSSDSKRHYSEKLGPNSQPVRSDSKSHHSEKPDVNSQPIRIFQDLRLGRWDSKRLYRMFDNVVVGKNFVRLSENSRVSLATQTDTDHFHHIYEMALHWGGPITVALFARGEDEIHVLEAQLRFLLNCYENLASQISFHLVLPKTTETGTWNLTKLEKSLYELYHSLDCQLYDEALRKFVNLWKPDKNATFNKPHIYPQNHLRNLARKNSQTSHVFLADVDIVPCLNLWERLQEFLSKAPGLPTNKSNSGREAIPKIAYVVPTYEVDEKAPFPKSKKEMVELANQGLARPFHQKIYSVNQGPTDFRRWQKVEDPDDSLRIAYITKYKLWYEPFYIALDNVPPHDERFLGFGFTRNTQVYEMAVSGYTFSVLSPAFAVHWGFQTKKTRPKWRDSQVYQNNKKVKAFRSEVAARYSIQPSKPKNVSTDPTGTT